MDGNPGETKWISEQKLDVVIDDKMGKDWVRVTVKNSHSFYPSFEDLYRIIQAISICEDKKYPNGRGRAMVADFLRDAVFKPWHQLKNKYQIPNRNNYDIAPSATSNLQSEFPYLAKAHEHMKKTWNK